MSAEATTKAQVAVSTEWWIAIRMASITTKATASSIMAVLADRFANADEATRAEIIAEAEAVNSARFAKD